MRLLEVKQKLDSLLIGETIQIEVQDDFNGYAHTVLKSRALFSVLKFLSDQTWNKGDFTPIQAIISKHNALQATQIILDQTEYGQLAAYVAQINQQLPIFLGILNSIVTEQTPEDINIKLSESIDTPVKLEKLVKEIIELEKFSNIDGKGFKFSGFEKGSEWIVISAVTSLGYGFVMACLKLAQEIMKTKQQYFKTEEAKVAYLASLDKVPEKMDEVEFAKYLDKYTETQLTRGAQTIASSIGQVNGSSVGDLQPKVINTTKSLINIIGDGNEIHLSLSSPKEITESAGGSIEIDYSYLSQLVKKDEPKQLDTTVKEKPDVKAPEDIK